MPVNWACPGKFRGSLFREKRQSIIVMLCFQNRSVEAEARGFDSKGYM